MTDNAGHSNGRRTRSAAESVASARADADAGVVADSAVGIPALEEVWARWAIIAAGFAALRRTSMLRIEPSRARHEHVDGHGSTLALLPGDRAVLSGGVADSAESAGADSLLLPDLFAGAPAWVAEPVLDPRAAEGRLTFCFWWDSGRWFQAVGTPSAAELSRAIPSVWSAEATAKTVGGLALGDQEPELTDGAYDLVLEAEAGTITWNLLCEVFDDPRFDIDGAWYQLEAAGVAESEPAQLPAEQAIARVRDYITARDLDTTGYPLDQLVAERFSIGWMVFVPVPRGSIAIDRAIFYLGDDGTLEPATSAVAPSEYIAGFERRYGRHA